MRLTKFRIENFRSIKKAEIDMTNQNLTVLVGKNNVGKSNILTALERSLGYIIPRPIFQRPFSDNSFGVASRGFERSDYRVMRNGELSDVVRSEKIVAELKFVLDEKDNDRPEILLNVNEFTILITCKLKETYRESPEIELCVNGQKYNMYDVDKPHEIRDFNRYLRENIFFYSIHAERTEETISSALDEMFRNRLRKEKKDLFKDLEKTQTELMKDIANSVGTSMRNFFPSDAPRIWHSRRPPFPERNIPEARFNLQVENGIVTDLRNQSDGFKNIIALSVLHKQVEEQISHGAIITTIEEPESHLHPELMHKLKTVIEGLANKGATVIITTHNPIFIQSHNLSANYIVNDFDGEGVCAKVITHGQTNEIRNILGVQAYDNLMTSKFVLLVEGESDKIVLDALLKTLDKKIKLALTNNELIVQPTYGSGQVKNWMIAAQQILQFKYTLLMDNDTQAPKQVSREWLVYTKDSSVKKKQTELEDFWNSDFYKDFICKKYCIDKNTFTFDPSKKWSINMDTIWQRNDNDHKWKDGDEGKVKCDLAKFLADAIAKGTNPNELFVGNKIPTFIEELIEKIHSMLGCNN